MTILQLQKDEKGKAAADGQEQPSHLSRSYLPFPLGKSSIERRSLLEKLWTSPHSLKVRFEKLSETNRELSPPNHLQYSGMMNINSYLAAWCTTRKTMSSQMHSFGTRPQQSCGAARPELLDWLIDFVAKVAYYWSQETENNFVRQLCLTWFCSK